MKTYASPSISVSLPLHELLRHCFSRHGERERRRASSRHRSGNGALRGRGSHRRLDHKLPGRGRLPWGPLRAHRLGYDDGVWRSGYVTHTVVFPTRFSLTRRRPIFWLGDRWPCRWIPLPRAISPNPSEHDGCFH